MSEITPKMFLAWVGTGDANSDFEIIAAWFHDETGMLAPGKDCRVHSYDERREEHKKWLPGVQQRMARYARQLIAEKEDAG